MSRISNALIDKIIDNALAKAGITKALEDWAAARFAWIEQVRLAVNGMTDAQIEAAVAKVKKAYDAIPEHMRDTLYRVAYKRTHLNVNLAGANLQLWFPNDESRFVPNSRQVITADSPLCQQFHDQETLKKELDDKAITVRAQVRAACKQVTTVKKLLDAWPEVKELLPAELEESKINLPALVVADLNALIGLPSDEGAKAA